MAWRTVSCGCGNGLETKYDEYGQESGTQTCSRCGGDAKVSEEYEENNDAGNLFRALSSLPPISESSPEKEEAPDYGNCSKCGSSLNKNGFCTNSYC